MNYHQIISDIENKILKPTYFLIGEEPYYIDKLSNMFVRKALLKENQDLNQVIFYGNDTTVDQIISECRLYPFGSERRLVIVKEAQNLKKIELLNTYIQAPQISTTLVVCYKNKTLDKRKNFGKNLSKNSIVFESKKLYDNEIHKWIINYTIKKGFTIDHEANALISEFIGNNLSKLVNELDKLFILNKSTQNITTKIVEQHIGISKEHNIFELQNALSKRDFQKTIKIVNYFSFNSKSYNIIPIVSSLFSFFQKVMIYHFINQKNITNVCKQLKINSYFIKQYEIAAFNYSKRQLFDVFKYLKEYDLRSKGVNNKNTTNSSLIKELTFKILHT